MKTTPDQLEKATKALAKKFKDAGMEIVIIANYGAGYGSSHYEGDEKTMLPAIIFEALRSNPKLSEFVNLAIKARSLTDLGLINWPQKE